MVTRLPQQKMSDSRHARPVVEDPSLPQMTDTPGKPRRIGGKILEMPMEPKPPAGSANRMDPLPKSGRPKAARRRAKIGEQEELPPRRGADTARAEGEGPGYVRLRVRVAGEDLTVEGIKHVPGPVVAHGPGGYELTPHGKRLLEAFLPLHAWAEEWAKAVTRTETGSDPSLRAPPPARRSHGRRQPRPRPSSRQADHAD